VNEAVLLLCAAVPAGLCLHELGGRSAAIFSREPRTDAGHHRLGHSASDFGAHISESGGDGGGYPPVKLVVSRSSDIGRNRLSAHFGICQRRAIFGLVDRRVDDRFW